MTSKNTSRQDKRTLLAGASVLAAAAAAMSAAPAQAQEADFAEEEAIVVTGTRLVRQDFRAISPVTTVGAEQLELTATLTTDSLLNELPQIVPGNTRTSNNAGGEDFATVDLRGLGPGRTLVLVNGERVPVSSTSGAVDLNTIPASLISRIEVVTGGASAVYGSDAMAGVVNFVLKDDYEGAEVNLTYGAEMETGNAAEFEVNGLIGGNFDNSRGNLTAYASYYTREHVMQSEYDFSRVAGGVCYDAANGYYLCDTVAEARGSIAAGGGVVLPGGSGTPSWGWIADSGAGIGADWLWGTADDTGNPFGGAATGGLAGPDGVIGPTPNGPDGIPGTADDNTSDDAPEFNNALALFTQLPGQFAGANTDCNPATAGANVRGGNLSFNDAGQLTPRFTAGACAIPDRDAGSSRYNFAPDNMLLIPAERIALTTNGHYNITDSLRLNLMMSAVSSRTETQGAATPAQGVVVTLTPAMQALISADHPDLWAALQSRPDPTAPFVMDRRFNEVGTRNQHLENTSIFFLSGLEGALGENWDWNLSASYGQVLFNMRNTNSVNRTALGQGLAGCQDLAGNPLGQSALPGCVALDIFGENTLTPEMVDFIRVNTFTDVQIEESRITGFVRGDLFELPAGPAAAVFGFEYRDTYAGQFNDNEQRTGNIYGFNAIQDQEGQIDVYELYTEFAVPLISEAPFAHYLGLEAGYRRSNYSTIGDVDTYKIGGEWAPVEWLRFRGVFNEATRAPNVFELFQNGDQGFPAYVDPCKDSNGDGVPDGSPGNPAPTQALCVADGVPIGNYPGFPQNNSQVEAFAFGNSNLQAETAETLTYGFVLSPDWFPIGDFRMTVDYYDIEISDVIIALDAQFFIDDCYSNAVAASCDRIARDITGQIDFVNTARANQASMTTEGYDIQVEWSAPVGPGQLTVNELYSIIESFTLNDTEFAGTTSANVGGAFPDYKSVLTVSYGVDDWTLFGRWSYVPEMQSGLTPIMNTPEASYIDLSVRWNVTDNFTFTTNIDNAFDERPPQTTDGFFAQANTDPQVYRVLGRTFAISGRYRF